MCPHTCPITTKVPILLFDRVSVKCYVYIAICMSQTQPNATKYNDGNTDARTNLLRTAKVEESQIATLAKSRFETLPKDVQEKLNA